VPFQRRINQWACDFLICQRCQNFLVIPLGWRPDLRDRLIEDFKLPKDIQLIDAPTPYAFIAGRTKTDGPQDHRR
jgi:hypothetical protein